MGFEVFAFDKMCVLRSSETPKFSGPGQMADTKKHGIIFSFISPSCWNPVETWPFTLRNLQDGRGGVHSTGT